MYRSFSSCWKKSPNAANLSKYETIHAFSLKIMNQLYICYTRLQNQIIILYRVTAGTIEPDYFRQDFARHPWHGWREGRWVSIHVNCHFIKMPLFSNNGTLVSATLRVLIWCVLKNKWRSVSSKWIIDLLSFLIVVTMKRFDLFSHIFLILINVYIRNKHPTGPQTNRENICI